MKNIKKKSHHSHCQTLQPQQVDKPLCLMGIFIMIGIYKITSPSKKIYIGQSINIEKRFNKYKGLYCKSQTRLYNSLKKHGVNKHKFEILHQCEPEQLNELEIYYIELFQCFNSKYGLNIKSGGSVNQEFLVLNKIKKENIINIRKYYIKKNLPITSIIDMVLDLSEEPINYFNNVTEYIEF